MLGYYVTLPNLDGENGLEMLVESIYEIVAFCFLSHGLSFSLLNAGHNKQANQAYHWVSTLFHFQRSVYATN